MFIILLFQFNNNTSHFLRKKKNPHGIKVQKLGKTSRRIKTWKKKHIIPKIGESLSEPFTNHASPVCLALPTWRIDEISTKKKKRTNLRKIEYLCRRAKGIRFHYQLQSAPINRQWMPHFFLLHEEFRDYFCFHSQLNYKGKTWGSSQERSNKSTTLGQRLL